MLIIQRTSSLALLIGLSLSSSDSSAQDQVARGPLQQASRLDSEGKTKEARTIFQSIIDTASTPAAKAAAQRAMAMSYAFDADCTNAVKYEQ
ncbi:MAG: hypothetical protein ABIS27_05630, partial [Longimicrobiales bacterium]